MKSKLGIAPPTRARTAQRGRASQSSCWPAWEDRLSGTISVQVFSDGLIPQVLSRGGRCQAQAARMFDHPPTRLPTRPGVASLPPPAVAMLWMRSKTRRQWSMNLSLIRIHYHPNSPRLRLQDVYIYNGDTNFSNRMSNHPVRLYVQLASNLGENLKVWLSC